MNVLYCVWFCRCYNKMLTFWLIESTYRTLFDGPQDRKFAIYGLHSTLWVLGKDVHTLAGSPPPHRSVYSVTLLRHHRTTQSTCVRRDGTGWDVTQCRAGGRAGSVDFTARLQSQMSHGSHQNLPTSLTLIHAGTPYDLAVQVRVPTPPTVALTTAYTWPKCSFIQIVQNDAEDMYLNGRNC